MFAEGGDIFHVEFVEGDDAVDGLAAGHVADRVDQVLEREFFGHEEHFVDGVARPVAVAEFFDGEEQDAATQGFAGAEEFLAFFVGGYGEDGLGAWLRHVR